MISNTMTQLNNRDRAVLRAIAEGRAAVSGECGTALFIDGLRFADQFAGARLANAGLISPPSKTTTLARLTPVGLATLQAA
jgi:hypothetical protein